MNKLRNVPVFMFQETWTSKQREEYIKKECGDNCIIVEDYIHSVCFNTFLDIGILTLILKAANEDKWVVLDCNFGEDTREVFTLLSSVTFVSMV